MNLHFRFTLTPDDDRDAIAEKLFELSKITDDSVEIAGPNGWEYAIQAHKGEIDTSGLGQIEVPTLKDAKRQLAAVIEAWEAEA